MFEMLKKEKYKSDWPSLNIQNEMVNSGKVTRLCLAFVNDEEWDNSIKLILSKILNDEKQQ